MKRTAETRDSAPTPDEEMAEEIRQVSPEGTPAHPEVGARRLSLALAIIAFVILVGAIVVSLTIHLAIGLALLLVALLVLLANPTYWASMLRAGERGRAAKTVQDRHAHPRKIRNDRDL